MNLEEVTKHLTGVRKEQGLPLRVVADRIGVSFSHLWRLEHNQVPEVPAVMLERWADALGQSLKMDIEGETNAAA